MFNPHSRIIVIESSVDGTGPRRGSIGYVVGVSEIYNSNKHSVCTVGVDVIFTKYGHEKKHRFERKNVVALFPTTWCTEPKNDKVKALIEKLKTPKSNLIDDIRKMRQSDPYPIIIAAPLCADILSLCKEELNCWLSSFLCGKIPSFASRIYSSQQYTNSTYPALRENNIWDAVIYAGSDRQVRSNMLKDLLKLDRSKLKESIKALIALSTIGEKQRTSMVSHDILNFLDGETEYFGPEGPDPILNNGVNNVAFSPIVPALIRMVIDYKKERGSKNHQTILENILANFEASISEFSVLAKKALSE